MSRPLSEYTDEKLIMYVADLERLAAEVGPYHMHAKRMNGELSAALVECGRRFLEAHRRGNFPEAKK